MRGCFGEELLDRSLWSLDRKVRQFQQGKGCGQPIIEIIEDQMRNRTAIETCTVVIEALIIDLRALDIR